ncbi:MULTISPECIES: flagellar hook-associated protein 3 [Pseudomonas]|uniref:Flagellar hook-associated protein 3 n=1 Tax=Pseudomonas quercus TaxID=2722792 RepID=A0ABX0YLU9_9PSED|nr:MULTISPECIES: flagellar hook-associated protein 3 [Pseudomonas]MBF7144588.1 flagellar hook-associated protein 3 [Pseudomonas sp. LY10J]NJP03127.1 flagellar hook-associated protein 3 [Pseudomonas quercus]
MRISTGQYFANSSATYTKNFADTAKTQNQISSGQRIQTAADDPVGAAKLLQLRQQSAVLDQYKGNITSATNSLSSEESVLANITTALQRAGELAIQGGNGAQTDDDRASIASEIGQIKDTVFGLLNTKDSNGQYLFSGSKTSTQPYSLNSDGSYTYQGDETQLSLQVSDNLSVATNDSGFSIFDLATNTSRTQTTQVSPATVDGKLTVSAGQMTSMTSYNTQFAKGEPYSLTFTSGTQYTLTDASGNDVTAQSGGKGTYNSAKEGGDTISLYGVNFMVNTNVAKTESADTVLAGRTFSLKTTPDTITANRLAGNTSTAQMTAGSVTNAATYTAGFPTNGALIKFTSASSYQVFAQPVTDSSKPITTGAYDGSGSLTTAGVTFNISGTPATSDQFTVSANTHSTQNVLDTLNQLQVALNTPTANNPAAQLKLRNSLESAVGNLQSATNRVDVTRGSIGARENALQIQSDQITSLHTANATTQSQIGDTDLAEATTQLTLQQTMLQAAQLSFAKISQLNLFDRL